MVIKLARLKSEMSAPIPSPSCCCIFAEHRAPALEELITSVRKAARND
jgi:hypothetical protein